MHPFRIDVRDIVNDPGASAVISDEYPLETFSMGPESYTAADPATIEVSLTNVGEGILARGSVRVTLCGTCARCLNEFPLSIHGDIETLYVPSDAAAPDDEDTHRIEADELIDLAPVILAAIVIEIPLAPLHDASCKGLCPQCGIDRNESTCDCASDADDDHPFSVLRSLVVDEDS